MGEVTNAVRNAAARAAVTGKPWSQRFHAGARAASLPDLARAAPMAAGTAIARAIQTPRIQPSGTRSGIGTKARTKAATLGKSSPQKQRPGRGGSHGDCQERLLAFLRRAEEGSHGPAEDGLRHLPGGLAKVAEKSLQNPTERGKQ